MSLAVSILAGLRTLSQRVRVDSATIMPSNPNDLAGNPGVGIISISKSFDSPVPTAEITVNRIPTRFARGQSVSVDLGYDNVMNRRFTGFLQSRNRRIGTSTLTAAGTLYLALRTVDSPEVDVSGMTIKQAIASRLDFCGISNYSIDDSMSDFTLGTVTPAKLPAGPLADQIALLMDIRDAQAYELGSGQVIVRPIDFQPAPTAFKTYDATLQATARVLDGSDREDGSWFRDQVTVTGAAIPNGDPDDPDTVFEPLTFTANLLGSGLQQPPAPAGAYSTAILSQPLIDTAGELAAYATRKLTRFGRIPRYVSIELPGDPEIELGQTLGFNMPLLDMGGRWFVYGIEDSVDNSPQSDSDVVPGYRQFLTLRGGDQWGGTVAISPIAMFTYAVVLQAFGDDLYAIITLDASGSFDPDGTIVSWAWSGDVSGSGQVLTAAVLASSGATIDVTLTVTDSDGLTNVATESISIESTGFFVVQPAVYCAALTREMCTPDGGVTFNDQNSASDSYSTDAKPTDGTNAGIACYGFSDGSIKRTTGFSASALTTVKTAGGGAINDIWWDKIVLTRVWACSQDGKLYRSVDDGITWTTYKDFGGGYPLHRIATPIPGGVWVFGGRADQPATLIQYDAFLDGNWQSVATGGELATNIAGASSAITVAAAYGRVAGELGIIFKGGVLPGGNNIFWTPNVLDGAAWKEATGLDAGLGEGRVIMPDFGAGDAYAMYNNRDVWYIDTNSGVPVCTKGADFLPVGFTPNHGLWEGEFLGGISGVHLIAAENAAGTGAIFKSIDGMTTADFFRPVTGLPAWPAGAKAKMLAIGAPGSSVAGAGLLARMGASGALRTFNNTNSWPLMSTAPTEASSLKQLLNGSWLYMTDSVSDSADIYHSPDGIIWTLSLEHTSVDVGVQGFDVSADGSVYAVMSSNSTAIDGQNTKPMTAWKSPSGAPGTWTLVYTDPGYGPSNNNSRCCPMENALTADKWDASKVFIGGRDSGLNPECWYTTDAGATWTPRDAPADDLPSTTSGNDSMEFVANGRILYFGNDLFYSDDLGDTWTVTAVSAISGILAPYRVSWFNNCIIALNPTGVPLGEVWISRDNGSTWAEVGVGDVGDTIAAIDYEPAEDRIAIGDTGTVSSYVFAIDGAFNGTPTLVDISFDSGPGPTASLCANFLAYPR